MKKLLILLLIPLSVSLKAQEASVEKSMFGIQAGFLGGWLHHELKLSRQIALRSEIGFDAEVNKDFYGTRLNYVFKPVLSLEPRWYVGLERRAEKNRKIGNNSANFISLETSYAPNWITPDSDGPYNRRPWLSFIPKVGMRRSLGTRFNYEAGLGMGEVFYFGNSPYWIKNLTVADIHLRVGYRF